MILEDLPDLEIVGEASDGAQAVRLVESYQPDVTLMDIRMPVMDGIEATRRIVSRDPSARVLILTTFDLDEYAFAGLRAGASGFLLKDVLVDELASVIRVIATGDAVVAPRVTRLLLDTTLTSSPPLATVFPALRRAGWIASRYVNAKCCSLSPADCQMPRSPPDSQSQRPPPNRTSPAS